MNELSYEELLDLHQETLIQHGGLPGVKDEGFLLSALAQPSMSYDGEDLYPSFPEKAAALGFSLAKNHAFNDGNKRVAFIAMTVFLAKNGYLLDVPEPEVISFMLALAASQVGREELVDWVADHVQIAKDEGAIEETSQTVTSFGEASPLSDKAKQIEEDRPPYWKPRIFAQVILDEMEKCIEDRSEHRQNFSSGNKTTFSQEGFFDWFQSEMRERGLIVENQGRVINLLSDAAFFKSEDGGNLDLMVSLGREIAGIYKNTIVWSQQFRQVDMSPEFHPLLETVANYFDGFMEQIEQLPHTLRDELQKAEDWDEDGPYRLTIVLDFEPEDSNSIVREIDILARKLGVRDENGLSSADHVTSALSKSEEACRLIAQAIDRYSTKQETWTNSLVRLGNRPKSIARPQSDAILQAWAQWLRKLSREIAATFPLLHFATETFLSHGPTVTDGIVLYSIESALETNDAFLSLDGLIDSIDKAMAEFSPVREKIESLQDLSPHIKSASNELLRTFEDLETIFLRYSESCQLAKNAIRVKLEE